METEIHNPDNVHPTKIPKGWRITTVEENDGRYGGKGKCRMWKGRSWSNINEPLQGNNENTTYIVRIETKVVSPTTTITNLDPKGAAGKLKPQLQFIPPRLDEETSKALVDGHKYGPWNWRDNKVEYMTYLGAMKRHINKLLSRADEGDIDPSGAHHLGHIAANCAILLDAEDQGTLVDNRPVNRKKTPQ